MKKIFYFLLSGCLFLTTSCNTDVEVITDWKETTIVYGLLNQSDTAQYVKINKAFLGEGNALQMAEVYDSINYDTSKISVDLEKWENGKILTSIPFYPDFTVPKDTGIFSSPNQILYKTNAALSENNIYRLVIKNKANGKEVTSQTSLVKDFSIQFPASNNIINLTNPNFPVKVKWTSAANGRLYQLVIRFHYREKDKLSEVITSDSVDWVFGTQKTINLNGGENMETAFMGADFYRFLKAKIPVNNNVYRYVGTLDFLFSVAADDFNTYMETSKPSTGIIQEKPDFTNIENGIGVFSARYNKNILGRPLSNQSFDSLYIGQYTLGLGFCDPSPASSYYCN